MPAVKIKRYSTVSISKGENNSYVLTVSNDYGVSSTVVMDEVTFGRFQYAMQQTIEGKGTNVILVDQSYEIYEPQE